MKLFFSQLGWELFRLFARKRTYIGFAVFLAVEMLFFYIFSVGRGADRMEEFIGRVAGGVDEYFSGLTLAFLILVFTLFLLGTVSVCLVAGDILAKETEDGNLRLVLVRPITRFRLLLIKFLTCQIFVTVLFLFVGASALCVGVLSRGWGGGMMVWAPDLPRVSLFEWNEGMQRYFFALMGYSIVYLPVTGIAFMLGCFRIKPAAATIIAVSAFLVDFVLSLVSLPPMEPYEDYLLTNQMKSWMLLLYEDIPWARFWEQAGRLIGIGLSGFVIGWLVFERRDVKS